MLTYIVLFEFCIAFEKKCRKTIVRVFQIRTTYSRDGALYPMVLYSLVMSVCRDSIYSVPIIILFASKSVSQPKEDIIVIKMTGLTWNLDTNWSCSINGSADQLGEWTLNSESQRILRTVMLVWNEDSRHGENQAADMKSVKPRCIACEHLDSCLNAGIIVTSRLASAWLLSGCLPWLPSFQVTISLTILFYGPKWKTQN